MDLEAYREIFLGDFRIDERQKELIERLEEYYRNTPDSMSNSEAYPHWKSFLRWCDFRGYSRDEINRAKARIRN